jgi:hypothetical protein
VIDYNLSPWIAAINNEKLGGNVMKKLMKLVPAVLLAAAILGPHPVAAAPATVVGTINGGGTATMEALVDPSGRNTFTGGTTFGLGVELLSDGSARGHFDCVDLPGGSNPGNVFGEAISWSQDGAVIRLDFIGTLVTIPGGDLADRMFTVKIQQFGGAGVGHWTLGPTANQSRVLCSEILTSGQIVSSP